MTDKKKKIIIGLVIAVLMAVWIAWGNNALELNTFVITSPKLPKEFSGYRIAHISDLHNKEMGKDNEKLLLMLQEASPNIIAITGDLIDSNRTDTGVAIDFAQKAMEIAPCYYVMGNHEAWSDDYEELKEGLINAGVIVLEDRWVELEHNNEKITLLGLKDTGRYKELKDQDLQMKDGYRILLSHRPELFKEYVKSNMDLVLSGHAHGGQFRLPFIGGLVAPDQGLFPKYDAGLYSENNTNMIVSRGIGNSIIPIRINNLPEVILIELESE